MSKPIRYRRPLITWATQDDLDRLERAAFVPPHQRRWTSEHEQDSAEWQEQVDMSETTAEDWV